jgi:hypothetical protein
MARKLYDNQYDARRNCGCWWTIDGPGDDSTCHRTDGTTCAGPSKTWILGQVQSGKFVEISPADAAKRVIPNLTWPQYYSSENPSLAYIKVHYDGSASIHSRNGKWESTRFDPTAIETDVALGIRQRLTREQAEGMVRKVEEWRYFIDKTHSTEDATYVWRVNGDRVEYAIPASGAFKPCSAFESRDFPQRGFREITADEAAALVKPNNPAAAVENDTMADAAEAPTDAGTGKVEPQRYTEIDSRPVMIVSGWCSDCILHRRKECHDIKDDCGSIMGDGTMYAFADAQPITADLTGATVANHHADEIARLRAEVKRLREQSVECPGVTQELDPERWDGQS